VEPMVRWILVAQLAMAVGCAAGPRPVPSSSLVQKMEEEAGREGPRKVPAGSALATLGQRHVLFVGGFLNEFIPGYFDDNVEAVEEWGAQTSRLFPSSAASLEEDAVQVREAVLARHAEGGRPVVLVGHSKGGAAALLTALRYPELVLTGVIDRVVVIQGAIGGSPLAEALVRSPVTRVLPLPRRGLESLSLSRSKQLFQAELDAVRARVTPEGLERLFARVFYVRSWEGRGSTSFELAVTHAYLRDFGSGQNDGLLLQEDMKLEGAGVDLGVVASDHASLTVTDLLSTSTAAERKAFTRALFREIYEARPGTRPTAISATREAAGAGAL